MPERLRFFIDEDLPYAIAKLLGQQGFQAASALGGGRGGLPDAEQLEFAAANQYTLVTANIADYVELARQWMAAGKEHAGIVLVPPRRFPRRDAAAIAQALEQLGCQETPEGMRNTVRFL